MEFDGLDPVSYLWSTGDTTVSVTVSPSQTTTYWVTQTQNGISCTDSITITVNQPDTSYTNITACDSIVWNGTTYTQSGTYSYSAAGSNNYSMSFDGIDDEVIVTSNTSLSSNFTIQAWWYKAIGSTDNAFWTIGDSYLPDGLELYVGSGGTETKVYSDGSPVIIKYIRPNS